MFVLKMNTYGDLENPVILFLHGGGVGWQMVDNFSITSVRI